MLQWKVFTSKQEKNSNQWMQSYIANTLKWTGDEGEKLWWWGIPTWVLDPAKL